MGNKVKMDKVENPLFYDILPGDLYFLFPFQTPNDMMTGKYQKMTNLEEPM